jgi:hypothetical protein
LEGFSKDGEEVPCFQALIKCLKCIDNINK